MLRLALAQINPIVGDLKGNQQKIVDYIKQAQAQHADAVIFPELALTGYPPEDLLLKDHFIADNIKALQAVIKHTKGVTAIVGFVDRDKNGNLYNAAAVIENGKFKGVYHKQELPNYGVFDEKRYFKPGNENKIFSIKGVKVGINICEDIWVDKAAYYQQAKKGAKLLINISSSPYDLNKLQARQNLLKRRVKETKTFVCYVNLVGGQDELVFDGSSFVMDPKGRTLAMAKEFDEDLLIVDLNSSKKKLVEKRTIKALSQIERIYKALVLGTHDYVKKNGFQKVCVGLSGGIDSALVAEIAVNAIGKNNVIGVSMPSRFSSEGTKLDAKRIAESLGIQFLEIPIEPIFNSYLKILADAFKGLKSNSAEENIQARIRGNILMALSNKFGWLVLTTGNKSEIAVGYCTLYGDMSGGFAVIKDVPKTKVYELAEFVNKRKGAIIPQTIIDRAPSAELRENQKDQDTLPPYHALDQMLEQYVEKHSSLDQMVKTNDLALVKQVITMVHHNEYKRRQGAPGIKITPRAFGKDWRLPITNKYREF